MKDRLPRLLGSLSRALMLHALSTVPKIPAWPKRRRDRQALRRTRLAAPYHLGIRSVRASVGRGVLSAPSSRSCRREQGLGPISRRAERFHQAALDQSGLAITAEIDTRRRVPPHKALHTPKLKVRNERLVNEVLLFPVHRCTANASCAMVQAVASQKE